MFNSAQRFRAPFSGPRQSRRSPSIGGRFMRKLAWLLLFAWAGTAYAALPEAVVPTASRHAVLGLNQLDAVVAAKLDLMSLGEEDAARERLGAPPRFAIPERVSIDTANHGTWEDLGDGQRVWRVRGPGR